MQILFWRDDLLDESPYFHDPDRYIGIPNDAVLAVGRMTLGAGRLEEVGHEIAEALGCSNALADDFRPLTQRIKRRLRDVGVADCASGDHEALVDEVSHWCDRAAACMNRRHPFIHASYTLNYNSETKSLLPSKQHIRPQETTMVNVEDIQALVEDLGTLAGEGSRLQAMLLHKVGPNMYVNHWVDHRTSATEQARLAALREDYPKCNGFSLSDWGITDF